MDLSFAFSSLRRGWIFLLIGLLAGVGTAVALDRIQKPTYAAEGTYLVVPSPSDPDIIENIKTLDSTRSRTILTTLTEIMQSESILAEAVAVIQLNDPAAKIAAAALPEANGVTLKAIASNPGDARLLAESIAALSANRFTDLYRIYEVTVLDAPATPTAPDGPGLFDLLAIGAVLGLGAGAGTALLRGPDRVGRRLTVSRRIDAYGTNVTPLAEHERYQRVG